LDLLDGEDTTPTNAKLLSRKSATSQHLELPKSPLKGRNLKIDKAAIVIEDDEDMVVSPEIQKEKRKVKSMAKSNDFNASPIMSMV